MAQTIQLIPKQPVESEVAYLPVPCPTMEIVEQPAEFYRFRYESEIKGGGDKVGGLLLGRSSASMSKSFVKVRISRIDPRFHKKLQLIVCTVSPDNEPHPYYLHGDSCRDGYCLMEKNVDEKSLSTWDVTFDRLAVICTQKTTKAIEEGMRRRLEVVPALVDSTGLLKPTRKYDSRSVGRIRLAFCLCLQHLSSDQWMVIQTLFSDDIADKKESKRIDLEELNPVEVSSAGETEIAIYTRTPTTGINKTEAKVYFELEETDGRDQAPRFYADIKDIKKHLITVTAPDVRKFVSSDRKKATVTLSIDGTDSSKLSVNFVKTASTMTNYLRKGAR